MIKVGSALLEYAEQLERERGISKDLILDSLKEAMVAAYRKYAKLPDGQGLSCRLIEKSGEIGIYEHKLVVDEVREPDPLPEELEDDEAGIDGVVEAHGNSELEDAAAAHLADQQPASDLPLGDGDPQVLMDGVEGEDNGGEAAELVAEVAYDEDGNPIEYVDELVAEVAYDEDGNPIEYVDELVAEVEYDEDGNPIEYADEDYEDEEEYRLPPARLQISLADARKLKPDVLIGQELLLEVTPSDFGRIAAQSAKQVIMQRIREAEKSLIQDEFDQKQGSVVAALVQRLDGPNVIVSIGRSEAVMPRKEQLPGEYYRVGNKLRVYVLELRDQGRVPQIIVSQAHPQMVREVFELEVPEIEDGLVEIKNIAREAGYRTKVAVHSPGDQVDPQGACIGTRGSRIQSIVNELKNEKIDIIRWSDNQMEFIVNALAPARIADVRLDPNPENRRALVVVPDDQLSLAIGREGQNVRLAAKLTGYKLDIKSVTQFYHLREKLEERRYQQAQANEMGEVMEDYDPETANQDADFSMTESTETETVEIAELTAEQADLVEATFDGETTVASTDEDEALKA
jgi:transcription termination/antitermination protein NusA